MTKQKVVGVSRGIEVTDRDIERLSDEAEHGYDVDEILARRGGRPRIGSAPAEVVPVRIDPELRAAIDARAAADDTSTSEVIRAALRRYLDVA